MSAIDDARAERALFDNAVTAWDDSPVKLRNALDALIAEHEKALATLRAVYDVACFTCYGPRPASLAHFVDEAERLGIEAEA